MKFHRRLTSVSLCLLLTLGAARLAFAQAVVQTTTTSTGTISEFDPNTIVIRTSTSTDPIRYVSTKTTTYVDENGVPVSIETVKSGAPATVYYVTEGNRMVASKVVVKKASIEPVKAVEMGSAKSAMTTNGFITEIRPDTLMVRSDVSVEPIQYRFTRSTNYVDDSGATLARDSIRAGLPVTVYFRKDGGRMMASKVVVHRGPMLEPAVEETKTKTTTTTTGPTGQ